MEGDSPNRARCAPDQCKQGAETTSCGPSAAACSAGTEPVAIENSWPAAGDGENNGGIIINQLDDLGELAAAIQFCDDDDETEVFFGGVSDKEKRKAAKYEHRRTAVFQPTFRKDRSLMRYTMDHRSLGQVPEEEEEEVQLGKAKLGDDVGAGSKVVNGNHSCLNGFKHDLDSIAENGSANNLSNGVCTPGSNGSILSDANADDSKDSSGFSDIQLSIPSQSLDMYRIVHLEDISADEDSLNTSSMGDTSLEMLMAGAKKQGATQEHCNLDMGPGPQSPVVNEHADLGPQLQSPVVNEHADENSSPTTSPQSDSTNPESEVDSDEKNNSAPAVAALEATECDRSLESGTQPQSPVVNQHTNDNSAQTTPLQSDGLESENLEVDSDGKNKSALDVPECSATNGISSDHDHDEELTENISRAELEQSVDHVEVGCVDVETSSLSVDQNGERPHHQSEDSIINTPLEKLEHLVSPKAEQISQAENGTEVTNTAGETEEEGIIHPEQVPPLSESVNVPVTELSSEGDNKDKVEGETPPATVKDIQDDSLDTTSPEVPTNMCQSQTTDPSQDDSPDHTTPVLAEVSGMCQSQTTDPSSLVQNMSADSLDRGIQSQDKSTCCHGNTNHGNNNDAQADMSADSLDVSKCSDAAAETGKGISTPTATALLKVQSKWRGTPANESGDLFTDNSPLPAGVVPHGDTPSGDVKGNHGDSTCIPGNSSMDTTGPARSGRLHGLAMSTPLHASASHRSAFSAFITPIHRLAADRSLGDSMGSGTGQDTGDAASDLALTLANVCHIGSGLPDGSVTSVGRSHRSGEQSEIINNDPEGETKSKADTSDNPCNQDSEIVLKNDESEQASEVEFAVAKMVINDQEVSKNMAPGGEMSMNDSSSKLSDTVPLAVRNESNNSDALFMSMAMNNDSECGQTSVNANSSGTILFKETRFSPSIFSKNCASPLPKRDLSELEDSDVVVFRETGFSPTVQLKDREAMEGKTVACGSPKCTQCDIVTVSANDVNMSLSEIVRRQNDEDDDEGVCTEDDFYTPPSAPVTPATPLPQSKLCYDHDDTGPPTPAPVAKLFQKVNTPGKKQENNSNKQNENPIAKGGMPNRVKSTLKFKKLTTVTTPQSKTPTPARTAFGRSIQQTPTPTKPRLPPGVSPKLALSASRGRDPQLPTPKPPIFKCGTPRYLPGQKPKNPALSPGSLKRTAPPKFDLDDSPAAKSPAFKLSLEEKKQKLEMIQEEKRRVQKKLAKMQSPVGRSPARSALSPNAVRSPLTPTSADNLPRVRYKDTQSSSQSLHLNDAALEAVTKIHTLCNSQQVSKIVTKARASGSPVSAKHKVACKEASKLQWQEDLVAAGDTQHAPSETGAPAKPILYIRPSEDVFPFNDQLPSSPVVIRRLAKRTNTLCPSKT